MPILCTAVLLSVSIRLNGTERHWITVGARLIVVETFHQGLTYLCIDGWHVSGVIDVNETLLGAGVGRRSSTAFFAAGMQCAAHGRPRASLASSRERASGSWTLLIGRRGHRRGTVVWYGPGIPAALGTGPLSTTFAFTGVDRLDTQERGVITARESAAARGGIAGRRMRQRMPAVFRY